MNYINKQYKNVGLMALGMLAAVAANAQATPSAMASAVDFTQASLDATTVAGAVIVFSLGLVAFWIIYKLLHSAKRA